MTATGLVRAEPSACSPSASVTAQSADLIKLSDVWRHWGRGRNRRPVLRDVNLTVSAGTVMSVSGPNGAGKTTLLRIVTGILAPDQGAVFIDGISLSRSWRAYHRRIGFLSAGDRGLYARVTVRHHLEHWMALALVPHAERQSAIEDALARFELEPLASRRADRLSQGQRQRLRLALAFVHRPAVVLLDEPRNSLDDAGRAKLGEATHELLLRGGAVLCCGPAGEEQLDEVDDAVVIERGTLRPA
jgi:ABC-2 type transport system ATP-binding protein